MVVRHAVHRAGVYDVAGFHCGQLVVDSQEGHRNWYQWEYTVHVHGGGVSCVDDTFDQ